jgi:hypothetical protein
MAGSGGSAGSGGVAGSADAASGSGGAPDGQGGVGGGAGPGSGGAIATGAGGASSDAPVMVDAPPGDGNLGVGSASRCAGAGVALCESFENGLDATLWRTTKSGDGTAVVDDLHAARGSKALHVHTAGSGRAYISERMSFPATNNILYARMFLWFDDDITTSGHFSIAEGAGTGTGAVIRIGGQFKEFGVGTDQGASGDWTDHDSKVVPSKTWICLEFEFKGDSNEFHVWWDDAERTALHSGASKHNGFTMPTFNSLWFGWWMYNATEPQDLWIDEIAVDFKPIGCAR